jgi:rhodanese-related sulfurtransferase
MTSLFCRMQTALKSAVLFFAVALVGTVGAQSADVLSLDEAKKLFDAKQAVLVDIREPHEHATGVAQGAMLIPMSQLTRRLGEIPTDPSVPVLLICNTQNRSGSVIKAMRQQLGTKYAHVRYVHGGMSEWAKRGWPMVKP